MLNTSNFPNDLNGLQIVMYCLEYCALTENKRDPASQLNDFVLNNSVIRKKGLYTNCCIANGIHSGSYISFALFHNFRQLEQLN